MQRMPGNGISLRDSYRPSFNASCNPDMGRAIKSSKLKALFWRRQINL